MTTATILRVFSQAPVEVWTLEHAADVCMEQHWRGRRKADTMASWVRELQRTFPDKALRTLTTDDIQTYSRMLAADGQASSTVHAKLCCISTIYAVATANGYDGPTPHIPRPHVAKPLKWWLNPEMEPQVIAWLRSVARDDMADYVLWTVETGLRVEETLRVRAGNFHGLTGGDTGELLVPATKTGDSQRTIALSSVATKLACSRFMALGGHAMLFPMTYWHAMSTWQRVREEFGWMDEPTATLKALRRSFARRLSVKGAPLPVVQYMMGHKNQRTTAEYLHLVGGGYTAEEQRRWLS